MTTTPVDLTSPLERWAWAPAHEQAQALAAGELRAIDLIEHQIARIERFNPALNAIVATDWESAREQARQADAALARGERRPLLGVPVTVKEHFHVEGLVTCVGNPHHRDHVPEGDSPAVAALRAAGAVILGKSNVPVALADLQSYNPVYGVTHNPWNLARTPGGSSGGSAAAIAAALSALELGTDIGGSIRIPAHFTGIFGHKPTYGIVHYAKTGLPPVRLAPRDLSVAGPLARSAQDLAIALQVLINRDPLAAKGWRLELPAPRHERLADFRVLVLGSWPGRKQSDVEKTVEKRLLDALRKSGVTVRHGADLESALPDLEAANDVYRRLKYSSVPGAPAAVQQESESAHSPPATRNAAQITHDEWLQLNEQRLQIRAQWEAVFSQVDVVLSPVLSTTAFRHDHTEPQKARDFPVEVGGTTEQQKFVELFHWVGLAVLPGLPATSFPLGFAHDGLPVGAQAMGAYLEDLTAIKFAELFAQAHGGFVAPQGYALTARQAATA